MLSVLGTFTAGFVIAFTSGWLMTLVCLAGIPVVGLGGVMYMQALQRKSKEISKIYSVAGGLA